MSQGYRLEQILLTIGKWILGIFYLYINWYKETRGDSPALLYGLFFLLTAIVFMQILLQGKLVLRHFPSILKTFFLYAVYALFTGIFIVTQKGELLSSLLTFFAFSIICFDSWYICEFGDGFDWLINVLLICAIVCSIQTVLFGKPYYNGVMVTTMSAKNNPNALGIVMFFGIYAITDSEFLSKKTILSVLLLLVFIYTIILSGSRKAFIVSVLYIILYYVFNAAGNKKISLKKLLKIIVAIVVALFAIFYFSGQFLSTSMFDRLLNIVKQGTDNVRFLMYKEAIELWKSAPLFGIGYGQFASQSSFGSYSHSSYAEIISCGGLIGFAIFLAPFVAIVFGWIKQIFHQRKYGRVNCSLLFLFVLELALGLGQIFIYEFTHMLILTYIFHRRSLEVKCQDCIN